MREVSGVTMLVRGVVAGVP